MNKWKRKWKEEIDQNIPALSEFIKNAQIGVDEQKTRTEEKAFRKKIFFAVSSCVATLVVLFGISLGLYRTIEQTSPKATGEYVVVMEINPKATFSVDENEKITAVISCNEDADIVLTVENLEKIIGESVSKGLEIFTDECAKLGYINLNDGDAIRISYCAEKDVSLSEVENAISEYFKEKGSLVAVLTEKVEVEEFCSRAKLYGCKTIKNVIDKVKTLPDKIAERWSDGKSIEELQSIYDQVLTAVEADSIVEYSIKDDLLLAKQKKDDIIEIYGINQLIEAHLDNKNRIMRDYWSVKTFMTESDYTNEFAMLIDKMSAHLDEYELDYGIYISDMAYMEMEYVLCTAYPVDQLIQMLQNSENGDYRTNINSILAIMQSSNLNSSVAFEIYEPPKSLDDFNEKVKGCLSDKYNHLLKTNKEEYGKDREKVTDESYGDFINNIIEEYGSLGEYWKSLQ